MKVNRKVRSGMINSRDGMPPNKTVGMRVPLSWVPQQHLTVHKECRVGVCSSPCSPRVGQRSVHPGRGVHWHAVFIVPTASDPSPFTRPHSLVPSVQAAPFYAAPPASYDAASVWLDSATLSRSRARSGTQPKEVRQPTAGPGTLTVKEMTCLSLI